MISIPAPQWGATNCSGDDAESVVDFNPRSPVGSDVETLQDASGLIISIPAPQWGATGNKGACVNAL